MKYYLLKIFWANFEKKSVKFIGIIWNGQDKKFDEKMK